MLTPDSNKHDQLLVLRGIACIAVMLNHIASLPLSKISGVNENSAIYFMIPNGFVPVWIFFSLSSYLLTTAFLTTRFSLSGSGIVEFYSSRIRRLMPLFWTVQLTIIFLTVGVVLYKTGQIPPLDDWLLRELSILFAAPWIPFQISAVESWNSPIWSVILELHFIALLPLLVLALQRGPKIFFAGAILLTIALGISLGPDTKIWPVWYESHFYNSIFFLVGMLVAYARSNGILFRGSPVTVMLLTLVVAVCLSVYGHREINSALYFGALVMLPLLAVLLLAIDTDFQKPLPRKYMELLPKISVLSAFERIGAMSYSVYLTHKFVGIRAFEILRLDRFISGYLSALAVLLFMTSLVLVTSAVAYIEIECRFRKKA